VAVEVTTHEQKETKLAKGDIIGDFVLFVDFCKFRRRGHTNEGMVLALPIALDGDDVNALFSLEPSNAKADRVHFTYRLGKNHCDRSKETGWSRAFST
jgi:hypothetical protein